MTKLYNLTAAQRRKFIQDKSGSDLKHITKTSFEIDLSLGKNCENVIGTTEIPLGIAGPLLINQNKKYYLPLATTEGALVASINRGCKVISQAGGADTFVQNAGTTRGPYLRIQSIKQGQEIIKYIDNNWKNIQATAQQNSNFISLKNYTHKLIGKTLYLRFSYDTSQAMGMNMVTLATEQILTHLSEVFKLNSTVVSGNFCIDKKPAFSHLQLGRGQQAWAEITIPREVVTQTLKTTPKHFVEIIHHKHWMGSILSGSLGFNAQAANVIAALFIATGQDPAHIVEGSHTVTTAEVTSQGDLYVSVFCPALMVGTVGGGTGLPTQKEALKILGIQQSQEGDSQLLAQIVAAAVLAGEVSLTAALSSQDLGKAHQKFGRSKK